MESDFAAFSWSRSWNVARVTPEISSSPKGIAGAAPAGLNTAAELAAVAANDAPTTPRTVNALLERFTLEARFVCIIKWLLLPPLFQLETFTTFPVL